MSIKKHGLYSFENQTGYKINIMPCEIEQLDEMEQKHILVMADAGYQLRNKTTGSQGEGKKSISDYGRGGYLKGKHDGQQKATKEIGIAIEKYTLGLTSKGRAVADRKTAELLEKLRSIKNE